MSNNLESFLFDKYPISIKTEGISKDFNTTKPAYLWVLCNKLIFPSKDLIRKLTRELDWFRVSRFVRSNKILVTSEDSFDKSTPSIKSDLFSLLANASASLSEAFSESV